MRLMIWMGVLVWVFGASPLSPAPCHSGGAPSDPRFEMHDLVAGKLTEGECSEATEVSGTVTRVERNRKSKKVTAFRVRSDDGKDWTFDALKLKDNMRANVKDEFDAGIAKGDRVELSIYICGEKDDRIAVDAIAILRPD